MLWYISMFKRITKNEQSCGSTVLTESVEGKLQLAAFGLLLALVTRASPFHDLNVHCKPHRKRC